MSNSKEENEDYQRAFEIACNKGMGPLPLWSAKQLSYQKQKESDLTEEETNIFLKVKGFLDNKIVEQINNFTVGNRGILLVGGDYDLQSGAVAYLWFTHSLTEDDYERWPVVHKEFDGYSEKDIKESLFSQSDGTTYIAGTVLFLRDIDLGYTDVLKQLASTIRSFKTSRESEDLISNKYKPHIIIINTTEPDKLPGSLMQNFKVIELDKPKTAQGKGGDDVLADVSSGSKGCEIEKQRIPDNKFKQLCKAAKAKGYTRELGEMPFFKELSKMSKLTKYDNTGRGYKTWRSAKKRYYEVFPSKKTNH